MSQPRENEMLWRATKELRKHLDAFTFTLALTCQEFLF